jgi:predicted house-cleaning NTP pyrophosphatase (Maf/HAM1 superfamily)
MVEATSVRFTRLTPEAIAWYVRMGEGRDKAARMPFRALPAYDSAY